MALQCCSGANMQCSMGTAPAVFNALPRIVLASSRPAGNVLDHVPLMNIAPFGLCRSPANPVVAAATAAASGTLTPMPCMPATAAPWTPGAPTVLIGGSPALNNSSTLSCLWGGVVSFADAGQVLTQVP